MCSGCADSERRGQYQSVRAVGPTLRGSFFAILNDDDRWEHDFAIRLIEPLLQDSEMVAAFCDHFVIDSDGHIDQAASDQLSQRCSRVTLSPGRHEDSAHLSFGISAFPTVVGAVYRNSAAFWDRYTRCEYDVTGFYDLWLQACLLGSKAPVWYCPERLSSYRTHQGQLTSQPTIALNCARVWILQSLLHGDRFETAAGAIVTKLGQAYLALGRSYMSAGDRILARQAFWAAAFSGGFRWKAGFALLCTGNAGLVHILDWYSQRRQRRRTPRKWKEQ